MDRPCSVCKKKVITIRNCSECDKYFCVKCWIDSRCKVKVAGIPQPHRYNGKLKRVVGSCLVENITVETPGRVCACDNSGPFVRYCAAHR
jgi:hypothetical protein